MISSSFASAKSLAIVSTVSLLAPFLASPPAKAAQLFNNDSYEAQIQPFYTTMGNPADYVVSPGTGYEGVSNLFLDTGGGYGNLCTGGLLSTGAHILTAAHCLTDNWGNLNVLGGRVNFGLSTGTVSLSIGNMFVHENWTGDLFDGYDIAILELTELAPSEAQRYDIYRGVDEVGQISTKIGYGQSGNGSVGETLASGTKRMGENVYDASGSLFDLLFGSGSFSDALLAYDFDNGLAANDAFGFWFGSNYADLGLGFDEVNSARGDSGGPTLINGAIAGVTSFGLSFVGWDFFNWELVSSDVDLKMNSSFGEFSFDTRVSSYTNWIDGILNSWIVRNNASAPISNDTPPSDGNPSSNNSGSDIPNSDNPVNDNQGSNISNGDNPNTNSPDSNSPTDRNPVSVPEPRSLVGLITLLAGLLLKRNKPLRRSI